MTSCCGRLEAGGGGVVGGGELRPEVTSDMNHVESDRQGRAFVLHAKGGEGRTFRTSDCNSSLNFSDFVQIGHLPTPTMSATETPGGNVCSTGIPKTPVVEGSRDIQCSPVKRVKDPSRDRRHPTSRPSSSVNQTLRTRGTFRPSVVRD